MAITPPISEAPISYTVEDLISDALIEVGIKAPGEPTDGEAGQWAFRKANYMLDMWATSEKYVYATTFATYKLVPNLQPATIGPGPGATYVTTQRPVKIVSASVIIDNVSPPVLARIDIETSQWWAGVTLPGTPSTYPTNLYYSADFPNGSLYFWPIPTTAFGVRLETWAILTQFRSITDAIGGPGAATTVPPGYRNAIMLSLAESLQPGAEKSKPQLTRDAAAARAAIFGNNAPSANISTCDSGMPGSGDSRRSTTFSYRTRTWT